jgi:hypothetical protein
MSDRLETLREDLLKAGLSPAHVHRYLRELTEHRDDIITHLIAEGAPPHAAQTEADSRLGSNEALLLPMLANRRFRSLASRWPALVYLGIPVFCQFAVVALGLGLLLAATETPLRAAITDLGRGLKLFTYSAPVILVMAMLAFAHRRRASQSWPVAGALASTVLAAMITINVLPSLPGQPGEISVAIGFPALLPLLVIGTLVLIPAAIRR